MLAAAVAAAEAAAAATAAAPRLACMARIMNSFFYSTWVNLVFLCLGW